MNVRLIRHTLLVGVFLSIYCTGSSTMAYTMDSSTHNTMITQQDGANAMKKISFLERIKHIKEKFSVVGKSNDDDKVWNGTVLEPVVLDEKGTLIFSDSPEYISQSGITYAGTVQGQGRVYFYHVNETNTWQQMVIYVTNESRHNQYVKVNRLILGTPTEEYFTIGKEVSLKELSTPVDNKKTYIVPVKSHQTVLLAPILKGIMVKQDELFSGIIDFSAHEPVKITVASIDYVANPLETFNNLTILPNDHSRLRGTYSGSERTVTLKTPYTIGMGVARLEIANGREDFFSKGVDETEPDKVMDQVTDKKVDNINRLVTNVGNYGIREHIIIPTEGKGQFDLFFNPLGGAYAGGLLVTSEGKSRVWEVPSPYKSHIGHGTINERQYIGTYACGVPLQIDFMPAGASNLPVQFVLFPK